MGPKTIKIFNFFKVGPTYNFIGDTLELNLYGNSSIQSYHYVSRSFLLLKKSQRERLWEIEPTFFSSLIHSLKISLFSSVAKEW